MTDSLEPRAAVFDGRQWREMNRLYRENLRMRSMLVTGKDPEEPPDDVDECAEK